MEEVNAGGTISLPVTYLAQLPMGQRVHSPIYKIANLPMAIEVWPEMVDGEKCISIYAYCNSSIDDEHWKCEAELCFKILPQKTGTLPHVIETAHTFAHDSTSCGPSPFLKWDYVLNAENGFISGDGEVEFEATINIKKAIGIPIIPLIDFMTEPGELNITTDVTLVAEGLKLNVGKQYISLYSPVLKKIFEQNKEMKEISLEKDIKCETTAEILLRLGVRFKMEVVIRECEQFLSGPHSKKIPLVQKLLWAEEYKLLSLQFACLKSVVTVDEIKALKDTLEYRNLSDKTKVALLEKCLLLH